ncbi:MAG: hypothetical protein DI537_51890 [Stutzerimonas stutzeri]|nr:zf-TFIIB domain-containing protein [Actinomycetales bacterium]PZR63403.1 MAG: hypothetical protein DI537_51890 [Stutzerimonas stutzeri]
MKCPIDDVDLTIAERSGVEIDYCPKCRGVWLDRGELDKIIDRAVEVEYGRSYPQNGRSAVYEDGGHHGLGSSRGGKGNRRRGGFLGELFDF